ncbi:3-phosphoshikimate 1-carboxyvinyltransferase [Acholeplasma vituli]|uniref:3-phosphoshikimate 1-carboxyvinyltransferase n=1 Tax=Paracholeplasma vituli TaxID=69473 RepID=A0ABT2PTU8_9MOLU|nr:3-phosphoshikimate 1-carboxyvinyltransferase [Paracholeplasma vituli]MCU0104367.1 3-phosphoshikimate 1-carboxyvinyltransferase [Paracholeplasma vituli]
MNVIIHKPLSEGELEVVPSKSITHRALIAAALATGRSIIKRPLESEDTEATIQMLRALGVSITKTEEGLVVESNGIQKPSEVLFANESGSSLRFLVPVALLAESEVTFDGKPGLRKRPISEYLRVFDQMGIEYQQFGENLPLKIKGKMVPGEYRISGHISSQFVTGLLYALPLLNGDSKLLLDTPLESKDYVDMTISIQNQFGVKIIPIDQGYFIPGNQKYVKNTYEVSGDFSQAAFHIIAGILGANLRLTKLEENTHQADEKVLDFVRKMGGNIKFENGVIEPKSSKTYGSTIDLSQSPDIGPIMAVLCALSDGTSYIINASRLRIKESDRITAITTELKKLGAKISETKDGMIIEGVKKFKSNMNLYSWNDHRIVMALAIAAIRTDGPIRITGAEAINKSYPTFFEDYVKLKGVISYE